MHHPSSSWRKGYIEAGFINHEDQKITTDERRIPFSTADFGTSIDFHQALYEDGFNLTECDSKTNFY